MLTVKFELLDIKKDHNVLDLGAGAGRHSFEVLKRGGNLISLDLDELEAKKVLGMIYAMIQENELSLESHAVVINGNALNLPLKTNSINTVIASEVLEHIENDDKAIQEIYRVLVPGGLLAVTVPRFFPELINWALSDEYHLVEGGHVRIYRKKVLAQKLSSNGFVLKHLHYSHGLHSPYWWLKCFVGLENESNKWVNRYKAYLEKQIMRPTRFSTFLDAALSKFIGKSMVLYARKAGE